MHRCRCSTAQSSEHISTQHASSTGEPKSRPLSRRADDQDPCCCWRENVPDLAGLVPENPTEAEAVAAQGRTGLAGEGTQWRDAGYPLVFVVALLGLAWFRRGWLVDAP